MTQVKWAVRAAAMLALAMDPANGATAKGLEPVAPAGSPQASSARSGRDDGGWARVQRMEAGRQVIIGVTGRQPLKYTVLVVDAEGLIVVKPSAGKLNEDVQAALLSVGGRLPDVLAGALNITGQVEVKSRGIYRDGRRLMDLDAAVERIDRAAITDVRGLDTSAAGDPSASTRTRVSRALLGAAIGFGAGALPVMASPNDCSDCKSRGILVASAVGAGIGALIGLAGTIEHLTYYVAPKRPASALGDVPWERLRLALPPSLQGGGEARQPGTVGRPNLATRTSTNGFRLLLAF